MTLNFKKPQKPFFILGDKLDSVNKQRKKVTPNTKIGFNREVFKLCCKLDCLDVWLKIRRDKENPLNTIKRLIVSFYLKKDHIEARASQSMFNSLLLLPIIASQKVYRIAPIFNRLGLFPNTSRSHFIFALLDNCSFIRVCPKCKGPHMDVIQHTLENRNECL